MNNAFVVWWVNSASAIPPIFTSAVTAGRSAGDISCPETVSGPHFHGTPLRPPGEIPSTERQPLNAPTCPRGARCPDIRSRKPNRTLLPEPNVRFQRMVAVNPGHNRHHPGLDGNRAIPWPAACEYLRHTGPGNLSCDEATISGDSAVPKFVLSFCPFVIGIVGVWLAVRLLHKKSMPRVVTERRSFDYNRVLFAVGVGA